MKMNLRYGFGSIGGLVAVVTVAGMLTAAYAEEHNNQEACMSNLKKIGQALQIYVADNEGWFPPGCAKEGYPNWFDAGSWLANFFKYDQATIDSGKTVLYCPSSGDKATYAPKVCYSANGYILINANPGSLKTYPWLNERQIKNPSAMVVFFDRDNEKPDGWWPHASWEAWVGKAPFTGPAYSTRHSGGCNIYFLDGHVKGMNPAEVKHENYFPY